MHYGTDSATNGPPELDECQDWTLTSISENDTHTVAEVKRKLELCGEGDMSITPSTSRIIWAFSDDDPISGNLNWANYHGTKNRGSRSVLLVNYNPQVSVAELPDDAFSFDINVQGTSLCVKVDHCAIPTCLLGRSKTHLKTR